MVKQIKIVLTGGGTAGHTNPILAVAKILKQNNAQLLYLGTSGIERRLLGDAIKYQTILAGKLDRHLSFRLLANLAKLKIGFFQAIWHLKKFKPDVVFAKGGFVSLPVVLASRVLGIPLVAHESDIVIGLSNKLGMRFCRKMCLGFPLENYSGINSAKAVFTGTPANPLIGRYRADHKYFGFDEGKPVIFITGGSQGARSLNDKIVKILPELLDKYQIIFQTGARKIDGENKTGIWQKEFLDDVQMAKAYATADVVISRAGASSLADISCAGKPAILIPLPWAAQNHQNKNAKIFERAGAVIVLDQMKVSSEKIAIAIEGLFANKEKMLSMSEAVKQFYISDSASKIGGVIMGVISNFKSKNDNSKN